MIQTVDPYLGKLRSVTPFYRKVKVIRAASQFPPVLEQYVLYMVDGEIDMGTTTLTMPAAGTVIVAGHGFDVSRLYSSANSYTMFNGNTCNLFLQSLSFSVTGTNSRVFNVTGTTGLEAVEFGEVNFDNCTGVGTFDAIRQMLIANAAVFGGTNGFVFTGIWSGGVKITDFISRGFGDGTGRALFRGTSATMSGRFISDANINIQPGDIGYDFTAANFVNDASFILDGGFFMGGGTPYTIVSASTKAVIKHNTGMINNYPGGKWSITTPAATAIASTATFYKLAGTTTGSELCWVSMPSDNELQSDSKETYSVIIHGSLSLTSANNNNIVLRLRKYDYATLSYVELSTFNTTTNGAGRAENIGLLATTTVSEKDRIEVWVRNTTSTSSVTAEAGGQLIVSVRGN